MNKQKISKGIILSAIFVIGLFLITGGSYGISFLNNVEKQYVPVSAKIEKIKERKEYRRGKRHVHHDVTIRFHANNTTYLTSLNVYTPFMKEGENIDIMYNPGNPNDIHSVGNEKIIYIVILAAGILLILVDWFVLRKFLKTSNL